ncbi:hypothetical protein BDP27DRAFT_1369815 [Rhodocollybia butyracea]|uniref:Peptidase A1 domain-containing protein n=1 Tax=Rhodocollybia butyracea TaxID=206335 RepID=A0A9P5PFR3_9AGAR|nr:hypothetical protein BDP27DRAFT_1369815 [Rhodocollybia butyracea]
MGQTPLIILDNTSPTLNSSQGPWRRSDSDPLNYKNSSMTLLGSPPSVGEIDVEIKAQDAQMFLIGNLFINSNCSNSSFVTIFDSGGISATFLTPEFDIVDNILWDTAAGIDMPASYDVNMNCIDDSSSVVVDYALILPPPTLSLQNQLLFVNYTDDTIISEGQWQDSVPNGGPGMSSGTNNATLKFPFAGWNITLLGYFSPSTAGNITLGISVDEQPQVPLEFNGASQTDALTYFEYFTLVDEADSGNHAITIEVLEASLFQTFCFRGFTYIPDFATLNDLPDLSIPASTESSPTQTSSPASTLSTTSAAPGGSSSHQGLHGGAIAGVVVGVIVAMICLVGLIFWAMKRRAHKRLFLSPAQAWMESQPALANTGDTAQLVQGSAVTLPPGEPTTHLYSPPGQMAAGPSNSGNNGQNNDQVTTALEPDRTEVLLERLNNFMNAFQHPPAYGQER